MNELIKISQNENGDNVVSAKELYVSLGYDLTNWSKWFVKNITTNTFAIKGVDYEPLVPSTNDVSKGRFAKDFAISIDFAKRISMMARTEMGEKIRKFFIECETKLNKLSVPKLPTTYLEALKELVVKEERILELEESNAKLQFRSDFVDECFNSDGLFSMEQVCKLVGLPYGRNTMMQKLREKGILLASNTPQQRLVSNGYFKVVESLVDNRSFKKLVSTTYATQKGLGYIYKKLKEDE